MKQYSMNAIPHEKAMTPISGQLELTPVCDNLRCRYQANVMNMLLAISRRIVYNPDIIKVFIEETKNGTLLCHSWFRNCLLLAQILVHGSCSTTTVAHGEDYGCTTSNNVTTGKDGRNVGLHTLVDNDGVLTT